MRNLEPQTRDVLDVGDDGVARAYDSSGVVIAYLPLTNAELRVLESNLDRDQKIWSTVDGTSVSEAACQHPEDHVLPAKYWFQRQKLRARGATPPSLFKRLNLCGGCCDTYNPGTGFCKCVGDTCQI